MNKQVIIPLEEYNDLCDVRDFNNKKLEGITKQYDETVDKLMSDRFFFFYETRSDYLHTQHKSSVEAKWDVIRSGKGLNITELEEHIQKLISKNNGRFSHLKTIIEDLELRIKARDEQIKNLNAKIKDIENNKWYNKLLKLIK